MAARVITISSGKGGVGKTTATANLGVALAALGNRVACIDADIGLRNLDVVMGLENRIVYNIVDVVEGRARLKQAMIRDKRLKDELYLIPAAQTRDKTAISPSDMIRLCDELREMVDFILIDSPAGIERGFRNAIAPADEVIIVTNPEVSAVRDADRIIGLIEAENKGPGKLVVNRVKPDMVKRGDMLSPDDIIDILAIQLIGLVPEDENVVVSSNRGMPATLNSEESPAGRAFKEIARRIMGEDVPFTPLEEDKSLFGRLKKAFGVKEAPPTSAAPAKGKAAPKADAKPAERRRPLIDDDEDEAPVKPAPKAEPRPVELRRSPLLEGDVDAAAARPAPRPEAKPAEPEKKPEPKPEAKAEPAPAPKPVEAKSAEPVTKEIARPEIRAAVKAAEPEKKEAAPAPLPAPAPKPAEPLQSADGPAAPKASEDGKGPRPASEPTAEKPAESKP